MKTKLIFLISICFCIETTAQKNDTIFKYEVGVTSNINKGNLDQILLNSNLLLSKSGKLFGFRLKSTTFHQCLLGNSYDADYYPSMVIFYKPLSKISPYMVFRYEQSKRRGLESREMSGAGVSFLFNKAPTYLLRLSASLMYDATTFSSQNLSLIGNIESKQRQLWRLTGLINGNHTFFQKNLHLIYEIWVQPSVENLHDIRYQVDMNIDSKIYKNLFFRMKLFYFYETVLPAHLKQGDLRLSFGLAFKN